MDAGDRMDKVAGTCEGRLETPVDGKGRSRAPGYSSGNYDNPLERIPNSMVYSPFLRAEDKVARLGFSDAGSLG